ncbi:hypothetical protein [Enorma phocaeensis]|uniref:Uncharacterized protein n=1 Tax=Enorma phocaeensis TaxID=1871019 RepID=A0ABT7V6P2_9ACTN|nr:hypothetical protein [Enorma phocaeensis]MDM8274171.1 hypothetical protein [Enorma phocaeensis]
MTSLNPCGKKGEKHCKSELIKTAQKSCKKMFKFNIYVQNNVSSLRNYDRNRKVSSILEAAASVDPIVNFGAFRDYVIKLKRDVLKEGIPFGLSGMATESLFYGHLKALIEYAGECFNDSSKLLLPHIEHGIAWLPRVPANVLQPYVHCTVSQGAYRAEAIHAARPWLPHYAVGPYIHYAEPIYDAEQMQSMKREFGRTLLVFPAHTYELSQVRFSRESFVNLVFDKYASEFDTIMVSAYWHDADDSLFELFERKGAKVVSSGMREDPEFIKRLKTVICLSDKAVGNALGTNIGYCACLGVPFEMIDADLTDINDVGNSYGSEEALELARKTQDVTKACFQGMDSAVFMDVYNTYWGGAESIKSREEIRCILDISREVLDVSRGFTKRFPKAVSYVYEQACIGKSSNSSMKRRLLDNAWGNGDE